jgi:hypothetical protein
MADEVADELLPCAGAVTQSNTAESTVSEDDAVEKATKAARRAAVRSCKSKTCPQQMACKYTEKSLSGVTKDHKIKDESGRESTVWTSTQTTTGECACQKG